MKPSKKKKSKKKVKKTSAQKAMSALGALGGSINIRKNGKNRDAKGMFIRKIK